MSNNALAQQLQGTWTLQAFTLDNNAGGQIAPMGPNPIGYVTYGSDGWMSFQISAAQRQPYDAPTQDGGSTDQTLAAARSFLAYAGPYTVNEAQGAVVQQVAQCLIPNWVGDAHTRYITLDDNQGLMLTSDPFPIGEVMHKVVLRFRRREVTPLMH
nr:lipocalin-like domain-containing protein [uncultured Rhodoferax sp.]